MLHNQGAAPHLKYQEIHENELRAFVRSALLISSIEGAMRAEALEERQTVMRERSAAVMRHAREAIENAERVQERSRQLNIRINTALQLAADLEKEDA